MSREPHDACACREYNELTSRREFLARSGSAVGATAFAAAFPEWLPQVSIADSFVANRDVIVSIFLRGGADGLTLCVPFGDPEYYAGRPTLAIPRPDSSAPNKAIALDNMFGLPPNLGALYAAYQAGHLAVVHGSGLTYSTRSHFDAQRFMEVGKSNDPTVNTGWLGRHLATSTPVRADASLRALGFSDGLVDTLKGGPKTLPIPNPASYGLSGSSSTRSARQLWLENDYQATLEPARTAALDAIATINLLATLNLNAYQPANGAVYPNNGLGRGLRNTAGLIKADIGIEAAHLDVGGWDTHTQQAGGMAARMDELGNAIGAFWQDCIASGLAQNITVVVISEFGRNVRENGGLGTDHGRGTAIFALGRGIAGGRVITHNWTTLARENLADQQDLKVNIDYRDILAEIVKNRLGNENLGVIFPGYVPTFRGVTKDAVSAMVASPSP
ncbi:MAG: DUF1501 domain-containing protein [Gemmatimonadaceae bacterium]|nr:DUF1501 domain-containing protein [Gemmatimonadaceae bacterium]